MARGYFVTGTDTGVGKTTAAVALIHSLRERGLRVAAMKPVAAGCIWRDGQLSVMICLPCVPLRMSRPIYG